MATKKATAAKVVRNDVSPEDREICRTRLGAAVNEVVDVIPGPGDGLVVELADGGRYLVTSDEIFYLNPPEKYAGRLPVMVLGDSGEPELVIPGADE